MGGLVCNVHRNAVLEFTDIPSTPEKLKHFDAQMRQLYNTETIAIAVVTETTRGAEACAVLAKHDWSHADRVALLEIVEGLYEYA